MRRKPLAIVHFNDVYNLDLASRFVAQVKRKRDEGALVLFSGDCFSPSMISVVTEGEQMPPVLNAAGVSAACLGNHDFDFGRIALEKRMSECNFPWLLSNALDASTKEALCGAETSVVIEHEGWKIGLLGLIEWEWMQTLRTIEPDDVDFTHFVEAGKALAKQLREEQNVDLVIALTHMRQNNDELLAAESEGLIDLILGGHDHHYWTGVVGKNKTRVVKSGTDFRDFSVVTLHNDLAPNAPPQFDVQHVKVGVKDEEDPAMSNICQKYTAKIGESMERVLGSSLVELDARFSSIRAGETNIGNWVTDLMRDSVKHPKVDVVILNSGTFRADRIIGPGIIKMKDLLELLPMVDELVVLEMDGETLLACFENGVSQYPRLEGRFPQISGASFNFVPESPAGSRIPVESVLVDGSALDLRRTYHVLTKSFLADGKDGYPLKDCRRLLEDELVPSIQTLVRQYFLEMNVLNKFVAVNDRHLTMMERAVSRLKSKAHVSGLIESERDQHLCDFALRPQVEGRIRIVQASE